MYLTKEQIESIESFAKKLPESISRSKVEKLIAEIKPSAEMQSEQLDFFVSLSGEFPTELQNYPQAFAQALKNMPSTEEAEADMKKAKKTDLLAIADDTIAKEKEVKAAPNMEERANTTAAVDGDIAGSKEDIKHLADIGADIATTTDKKESGKAEPAKVAPPKAAPVVKAAPVKEVPVVKPVAKVVPVAKPIVKAAAKKK